MKLSSASATAGALSVARFAHAAGSEQIKLGLIGCGGRGAGAASQALTADSNMKLVAMADAFPDRLQIGLKSLQKNHAARLDVPPDRQFTGLNAFRETIAASDIVILATPCAFRPAHFEEAVRQGKHVFLEKPVSVDGPGVRRVLAANEEAKRKGLKVAVGFQRRHKQGFIELIQRIHDGQIGELLYTRSYANTPLRTGLTRNPAMMPELEYQLRNWYYFSWLSADFIVDNLSHGIDISNWIHGSYPVRCHGMGGRSEAHPDYGNLYDHFAVEWEYANGARLFGQADRHTGTWASVTNHATGSEGNVDFLDGRELYTITGKRPWQVRYERNQNPYQQEHDDWFRAIRNNLPYNEADYGARSTLTAIMGRMAAYSGQVVEWDAALNSPLAFAADVMQFAGPPPVEPDAQGIYSVAVPGKTVAL